MRLTSCCAAFIVALLTACGQPKTNAAEPTTTTTTSAPVLGIDFDTATMINCTGLGGAAAATCAVGVSRTADGATVTVTARNGSSRAIFFDRDRKVIGADLNQADDSTAYTVASERSGANTIVTIGPERYEISDALLDGD